MENRRDTKWEDNSQIYGPNQVEAVLEKCRIEIANENRTHFICYCPFHANTDSPAFAVDKYTGQWTCFNPTCMEHSDYLANLLRRVVGMKLLEANVFIAKNKDAKGISIEDRVAEALTKRFDFKYYSQDSLDGLVQAFWSQDDAVQYMRSRGFEDETLRYFEVGYSPAWEKRTYPIVTVPMHDDAGRFIGTIGRIPSHEEKTFHNSWGLPKTKTTWNFHRAKVTGDTVIVCESSYDAMRVHQAGYPNVVAVLGGHVSIYHIDQLGKTFSKFIIMTDYDEKIYKPDCKPCGYKRCQGHRPGRDLGRQLIEKLPNKKFLWAAYDDFSIYPHKAKDASDMTDDEIRQCLKNAVSNMTYVMWGIED